VIAPHRCEPSAARIIGIAEIGCDSEHSNSFSLPGDDTTSPLRITVSARADASYEYQDGLDVVLYDATKERSVTDILTDSEDFGY
jgi:hypothetical protein